MTANARVLEHAIRKMLSHPLIEVREIGEALRLAAEKEVPTLLKYAEPGAYLQESHQALAEAAAGVPASRSGDFVTLVHSDPEAEARVLAAALYPESSTSFAEVVGHVRSLSDVERGQLCERLLGRLGRHDIPLRHLEHACYTFEVVLDQGAYLELKRHRIMTQTPQRLSAELGYAVPRLLVEAGFEKPYREAMDAARDVYSKLADQNPAVAAYVVPNGYLRRVLMTMNLREAYHFCELRSAQNAHFSMRRLALRIAELIQEVHPNLSRFMRLPEGIDWRLIERQHFA
jgi:thymidylate synthase ThyX